ncbi:MAG TPA: hypothetical protein DCY40_09890 [Actinobacteria bacterium]|nr:hypothetical protein [Actinomycetota bacterium]
MSNIGRDLRALARLAPRPVRAEEAAAALGVPVAEVVDEGESLVAQGALAFRDGGFAPGAQADDSGASPVRDAQLAGSLADAIAAKGGEPGDVGQLFAAAGRWSDARALLAAAALRPGIDPSLAGNLAALALQAQEHAPGLDRVTQGRLRLTKARQFTAAGRSAEAMAELEVAIPSLDGVEQVDALGFATSVADNMQAPQRAETYAALGEQQAWGLGQPAKVGSLLTLHGRVLSRIGFPREADRVLEHGQALLDIHGDTGQRFRGRLNRAWVQLDRGEARSAEAGFGRLRDEAAGLEGPVSLADKEAYWARAAFAVGEVAPALAAADRATASAKSLGAPAPAFIAAIARAEGALYFERFEDALVAADEVLGYVESQFHEWENRARVLRGRALVGLDRLDEAAAEAAAALAATPEGVNGLRLHREIEVLRLLALPADRSWPQRDVENLTDELLAANWNLPALELMIGRAGREKDAELALYATGLAIDLGLPTVAVRAAHLAKLWADPAGQAVAFAAQGIVGHLPAEWAESWSQQPHVAAALAVQVADDEAASEALTAQWAAVVASANLDTLETLSPAQRRAQGLVRRRAVTSLGKRILQLAAALIVVAGVSVGVSLVLSNDEPDVIIQTTPTVATTTTLPPLEETPFAVPSGTIFAGATAYRGDVGRSGVIPDVTGVTAAEGYYWRYGTADQVVASPVTFGKWVFIASQDGSVHAVDMTTGRQLWTFNATNAIVATPVVAELSSGAGRGEAPPQAIVTYASTDGIITFREATQTPFNVVHTVFAGEGQAVRAAPLVVDNRVVVATAGPDSGRLFSIAPLNKTVDWTFPLSAGDCAGLTESVPECDPVGPIVGAPAASDGVIYFGTSGVGEGYLYAIDAATGQQVCRSVGLGSIEVNPVVVDGVVYALTTTGQLYAFAVPSCSTPAPNRNALYYDVSGAGAAPAVAGDLMIIPVGSQVLFLDLPTDTILHNFDAGSAVRSAPVIAGDIVYFGNEAGKVFALDLETAAELWTWQTGGAVRSSVTVLDGIVLVTSTDTRLYAIGGS